MSKKDLVSFILLAGGIIVSLFILHCCYEATFIALFEQILYAILTGCVFAVPGYILLLAYTDTKSKINMYVRELWLSLKSEIVLDLSNGLSNTKELQLHINSILSEVEALSKSHLFADKYNLDSVTLYASELLQFVAEAIRIYEKNPNSPSSAYDECSRNIHNKRDLCLSAIRNYHSPTNDFNSSQEKEGHT